MLNASVSLDLSGQPVWNYTLDNLESSGSDNWLTDFALSIAAPISNIQSPNGWFVDTDNLTYIRWANVEPFPYPNDIPPGGSISGFSFQSSATGNTQAEYTIASWNHSIDDAGPFTNGQILAPFVATVPESGISTFLFGGVMLGFMSLWQRRHKR